MKESINDQNENCIMVSVIVITFNHGKYIRQALDSILSQKRTFTIEILVGDDCSTDNTQNIISEYKAMYPELFKVTLRKNNVGATKNSYELFKNANGKYIAVLEGDDFWTDPYKLHKQIEFLEQNKQYCGCTCNFDYVNENGEKFDEYKEKKLKSALYSENQVYTVDTFNQSLLPGHAGTLVFKNIFKIIEDTTILYKAHSTVGDFTVVLLIISQGNIYRMEDNMSCYRHVIKKGSGWTASTDNNPFHFYEMYKYHTNMEKYAKQNLKIRISLKKSKKHFFFRMMASALNVSSAAKWRCIKRMILMTKEKHVYILVFIYSLYLAKIPAVIRNAYSELHNEKCNFDDFQKKWKVLKKETKGKRIMLYGAGGGCEDLLSQYYGMLPIECIVDNDESKQGSYIMGYKIYSMSIFDKMDIEDTAVIITTGVNLKEISLKLKEVGIKNCYSYVFTECFRIRYFIFKTLFKNLNYIKD